MKAFEFNNVSFAYSNHPVFEQLSLAIYAGDFVAIVGGNGSGKSTFLKLCVGSLVPDSGEVSIFGQPLKAYRGWHKVGYVRQHPLRDRAFPITVAEVVAMGRVPGRGIGRMMRNVDRDIIKNAMCQTGVDGFGHKIIGDLSGGQQQRVMVARALAAEPDTLILDEPTAGIDAKGAEDFYLLLQKLNEETRLTVLLVTHDVDRVAMYANKVISLDEGLKYYGPAEPFRQKAAATC